MSCNLENGKPEIVPNAIGEITTPSVISFDKNEILIGKVEKNKNENLLYEVKRLIGRDYDNKEIQEDMKYWPFKVIKNENNRSWFEVVMEKFLSWRNFRKDNFKIKKNYRWFLWTWK